MMIEIGPIKSNGYNFVISSRDGDHQLTVLSCIQSITTVKCNFCIVASGPDGVHLAQPPQTVGAREALAKIEEAIYEWCLHTVKGAVSNLDEVRLRTAAANAMALYRRHTGLGAQ